MKTVMAMTLATIVAATGSLLTGCSTAPKTQQDRVQFSEDAAVATQWFTNRVSGLRQQMDSSAGYIVFPDVGQWGILFGGGTFGRGAVYDSTGRQIAWAALNNGSIGLQAGVQGFKMMIVVQSSREMENFRNEKWNASAAAVGVFVDQGGSAKADFVDGVAVYQGANSGLMAGVNIGLNRIKFVPIEDAPL